MCAEGGCIGYILEYFNLEWKTFMSSIKLTERSFPSHLSPEVFLLNSGIYRLFTHIQFFFIFNENMFIRFNKANQTPDRTKQENNRTIE